MHLILKPVGSELHPHKGLEIDDAHNQDYAPGTTFHPAFLYEAIWNGVGVVVLILVDRRWRIRPPS